MNLDTDQMVDQAVNCTFSLFRRKTILTETNRDKKNKHIIAQRAEQ